MPSAFWTSVLAAFLTVSIAARGRAEGPSSGKLTVNSAINTAIAMSPEMRAARQAVEASRAREAQVGTWPNPNLTVAGDELPIANPSAGNFLAGISQSLILGGQREARLKVAEAERAIAELELENRRLAFVSGIKEAIAMLHVVASWVLPKRPEVHTLRTMDFLEGGYRRSLGWAMRRQAIIPIFALLAFCGSLFLATRLGTEFLPEMDEGSLAIQTIRLPSVSLTESLRMQHQVEVALLEFPEVDVVVSRTGRPEIASDPMGVNMTDTFVMMRP